MFVLFFITWIIFNGNITTEIVIFGLVIAVAVLTFLCKFMGYSLKKEGILYRRLLMFMGYVFVLIVEIVKANISVIHMIVTHKEIVEPIIVKFKVDLKSETAKVILANSITLTPGTITVSLEEDEFVVHCLDKNFAEGMENSLFVKLLQKMEKRG